MKSIFILGMLAASMSSAVAQPNYCMQETVVGTYAVATQGTMIVPGPGGAVVPVPAASLGIAAIDGEGAISSFSYSNMGGQITQSPMPGVIKVNSDCTATVEWGMGVAGNLLIMDEGKTMGSLMTNAGEFGSAVIYADWKRISRVPNTVVPKQCAPNALSGVYSSRMSGTLMMPQAGSSQMAPVPMTLLGMGSSDAEGRMTAKVTASVGGQMTPMDIEAAEPVKVNADCTALATWNHTSQGAALGQSKHFMVVLDGGNEVWGLATQNFRGLPIQLVNWTRVSPIPAAGAK